MGEASEDLPLLQEAAQDLLGVEPTLEQLEGSSLRKGAIGPLRLPHLAHAAAAQRRDQAPGTDAVAAGGRRVRCQRRVGRERLGERGAQVGGIDSEDVRRALTHRQQGGEVGGEIGTVRRDPAQPRGLLGRRASVELVEQPVELGEPARVGQSAAGPRPVSRWIPRRRAHGEGTPAPCTSRA
ncbi:MAG TPA: hypothetical protein VGV61_05840 [Thermoanaerobaculia bacterium]|nr:hypothetical protein [Thermoanaerobaculia bacterium]